jgi:hypothetical protein
MQRTKLEQQVSGAIETLGKADGLCEMLSHSWRIYHGFLEEQNLLPGQAEDIPQSSFAAFVARCEEQQMDDQTLHLVLAIVRVILLELGRDVNTMSDLSAPRKRKRVGNGKDGQYRFALVRATDPELATREESDSAPAGGEQGSIAVDADFTDPQPQPHETSVLLSNREDYQENDPLITKV